MGWNVREGWIGEQCSCGLISSNLLYGFMNESLSSGLNPLFFAPFSLFVPSLLSLMSSHCQFLYFSVISHSFLSLSERSFLSQPSAQKLYGGTSWLQAKTLLSASFSPSVLVSSNYSICPSSSPTLLPPLFFCFFLLHFLFSEEAEWVESVSSRMLKCALSQTHTHIETLWGDCGAIGLSASERGVSGNPLELVCEGLVNQRGKKRGRRKEEWREKKTRERKRWQAFEPNGPLSERLDTTASTCW